MLSKKIFWVFLFILIIFTRFYGLNWSNGFTFNPDENNMVSAILRLNRKNLNPDFFAYGQFPLYLTYFTSPKHDFFNVQITLRFWSAFFSTLSVFIFYLIGKYVFKSVKLAAVFALLIIFTPGLIQLSHFGTTESILIFVFAINLYLSFLFYDHPQKNIYLLLSTVFSGLGFASKISALILTVPFFFSLLFIFLKNRQIKPFIFKTLFFISLTIFIGILLSPYNLIKSSDFLSSMKYEIGVASGSIPVFYTRQFIDSMPYLFQLKNIFPYTNGLFVFIFGFIGFCFILKPACRQAGHEPKPYLIITLFSSLIYFIYQGQLFVKWTRFMSPIFFCGPLLSLFLFKKINNKFLQIIFIVLSILPGLYFFINTYLSSDVRIQATEWINQNISIQSKVLSEGGNVVDIPINNNNLNIINFDFYSLDDDINLSKKLDKLVETSDYIFVPSRRVFKNQQTNQFSYSQQYYQNLFSGNLGFFLIKTFSKSNSLFLNAENAEETWSVFDNPVIRIYQRQ